MKFVMRTIILLVLFMVASFAQTTKAVAMHIHRSAWTTLEMNGYKPTLYPNLYLNASLTQKIQKTDIRQLQEGQPVWLPVTATVNHREVAEWLAWENTTYSPARLAARVSPVQSSTRVVVRIPPQAETVQPRPATSAVTAPPAAQPKSVAPKQSVDRSLGGSRKNSKPATSTNTPFFVEVMTVIAWTILMGAVCALLVLAYHKRERIKEVFGRIKLPKIGLPKWKLPDWQVPKFKVSVPRFKFGIPKFLTKIRMPNLNRFWDWISRKLDEFLGSPGSKDQPVHRIPSIFTQPYSEMDLDSPPTMRTVRLPVVPSEPPAPAADLPRDRSHIKVYDTVILDGSRKDPSIPEPVLSARKVFRHRPGKPHILSVTRTD